MRQPTLLACALMVGCTSPAAPSILGDWGGTQASLTLGFSGGTLSYPCGAGTIDSAWTLAPDGQFSATGQHYLGGGPMPVQGRPPHPARYAGTVAGNIMTLTVTVIDLDQQLGPFHLVRGGPPVFEQCV